MNKLKENSYNEDELMGLWIFHTHVQRLEEFSKPLYRKMQVKITIPSEKTKGKCKNIPTELRLSALINEVRPFMLNDDPSNFNKIGNSISHHNKDNKEIVNKIRSYKKEWQKYNTESTSKTAIRTHGIYVYDGSRIETYSQLLNIFTYGKYIHNNSKKAALVNRIEESCFYPSIKMELGVCIANICNILKCFDTEFVVPIIKENKGAIKYMKWKNINIKVDK